MVIERVLYWYIPGGYNTILIFAVVLVSMSSLLSEMFNCSHKYLRFFSETRFLLTYAIVQFHHQEVL